ncbi:MAG: DUF1800 family protein, partial [Dokdonella sp.]
MHPTAGLFPRAPRRWALMLGSLTLLMATAIPAYAYDEVFASGFEAIADAPASDAEAARFLGMATFGPTAAEIAHLRGVGYAEWINQQLSMPTTAERPYVEQVDGIPMLPNPGQNDRLQAWLKAAITAPDQLRQRMAWAFSQIMVATYAQSMLGGDPVALAEYYDTLARDSAGWYDASGVYHAGTFPTLLNDVTRSPAMGKMLTYRRNEVGNPVLGTYPDENYAREVMQLFSIGLVLRHPDFSPIYPANCNPQTNPACEPIPTYPQATVGAYAQVFTGWSYTSGFNSNPTRSHWSAADYAPMICYESYHDNTHAKTLLSYTGNYVDGSAQTLPAGNGCANDLDQGLAILAHHPNVAPFISRQLIQRFTSSNPSPAYIGRVAQVFADNGSGVYGDLGAVIKAVLLDPEARYGAAPPPAPQVFGKAREPLLKLTALYRYYHAAASNGLYAFTPGNFQAYLQIPLGAPSVFNFYLPDYHPPGELGDAGLYGPEFQITNESSAFTAANDLDNRAAAYLGNPANTNATIAIDVTGLQALAATPAALVSQLDHDLMAGAMSAHMQATLTTMVGQLPAVDAAARVTAALQVLLASPEFAIQ